jgi:hypothetical protein
MDCEAVKGSAKERDAMVIVRLLASCNSNLVECTWDSRNKPKNGEPMATCSIKVREDEVDLRESCYATNKNRHT